MTLSTSRSALSLCALAALAAACKEGGAESGEGGRAAPRAAVTGEPAAEPGARRASAGVALKPHTAPPPLPSDPGGGAHGKPQWAVRLGGNAAESGRAIAVDARGDLYLAGIFRGTVDFGGAARLTARGADGYLARFGPDGAVRWARQLGSPNDDIAAAVALDPRGNAVVAGAFSDELTVGDGSLKSEGADDLFVAVFDPAGRRRWAKRMGGVDVDAAEGVAVDARGAIAVVGMYTGYLELGGGHELVGEGQSDILLLLLEPDGAIRWVKGWSSSGPDEGRAVAFDRQGNLYVLVEFSRAVDFGGGALESVGNRDLGLIKLDPQGRHIWSRRFGSNLDELGVALAVDPSGSVIITGSFDDSLDFGDGPMRTAGRSDVFVAKFAPDGNALWSRRLGNKDEDIGAAVATDPYGNVYVAGWFWRELDILDRPLTSAGKKDAFLYALSPAGDGLWARALGGPEDDYGRGLAADAGAVYWAGTFHQNASLGDIQLSAAAAPGARLPLGDAFLSKLAR
jgi:hypothetical protein